MNFYESFCIVTHVMNRLYVMEIFFRIKSRLIWLMLWSFYDSTVPTPTAILLLKKASNCSIINEKLKL